MIHRVIALSLVAVLGVSASAAQIDVKNASFEDPVQDVGGWTNTLPDWDGPTNTGNAFIEYIDTFSADGVNHLGIQGDTDHEVSQNLGVSLQPNSVYNLTVAVGRRNETFTVPGNESRFGLYVGGDAEGGGTLVADGVYDASPLVDLTFVDQTISYATGDTVPAGDLYISLQTTGPGRAHYDNVRLDLVPEPGSLALALCGLLGLLRFRRR